jgi:hypothetical protein
MLLILRRLKQNLFNNAEFRKYLLYALGETALVIVGILIALQIDNWNSERIQHETLDNYLRAIARNIGSDLVSMDEIRSRRVHDYELSVRWQTFDRRGDAYTVAEAQFAGQLISRISTLSQFNASSSGYEALKASGTLDQLQGSDIERLLYDYYDTAARISTKERDYNDLSRLLSLQVWAGWPDEFDHWELTSAYALTDDRFDSLQDSFRHVLENSTSQQFMGIPTSVGSLLLEYERLDRLGSIFRNMVENDRVTLDDAERTLLDAMHDPSRGVGQPNLIVDGKVAWHSHHVIASDANDPRVSYEAAAAGLESPYDFNTFRRTADSLRIESGGGVEWAGVWFPTGVNISNRLSTDYSMYDKLVLELKGEVGGERISVNMEDMNDPADGSSTRYMLRLSDQWQTYEIDLDEFETADLRVLTVPLGFVLFEDPVSFSIRNASFIKSN